MNRKDEMGLGRQKEPIPRLDPTPHQPLDFLDEAGGIHHRPAGNQAGNFGPQNSRGHQMENVFLVADFNRVARIVAPLGTQNPVGLGRHDIQYLSLSLISPLKTEDNCNACAQIKVRLIVSVARTQILIETTGTDSGTGRILVESQWQFRKSLQRHRRQKNGLGR
jgi:hypothetical protein